MSAKARPKAVEPVEMWAITVDGDRYMHDRGRSWLFATRSLAMDFIGRHIEYRRQLVGACEKVTYKPIRVSITPAPTRKR